MKYYLLSSRRSGSALLKHTLIELFNENNDGPDEWIVSPITRKNLGLPESFDEAKKMVLNNPKLLLEKMSPNSHRKVMYSQILKPKYLPKDVPIIHLIRRDAWSQAKSAWIMRKKLIPAHVFTDKKEDVVPQAIKFKIDIEHINKIAKMMLLDKEYWYRTLSNRPNTLTLFYEDDLNDIELFLDKTIPKIENFLNKKSQVKDFKFSLSKTRELYEIENLNKENKENLIKQFYFETNKFNKLSYYKRKLKHILT